MARKIDVNDLFNRIDKLCSIPFTRLEPLQEDLSKPSAQNVQHPGIKLPQTAFANASKGYKNKNELKLVKTSADVENLFKEIRNFCAIKLPFRLRGLDETDEIDEIKSVPFEPTNNEKEVATKVVPNRRPVLRSDRNALKKPPNHSFANLIFNFNDNKPTENRENIPRKNVTKKMKLNNNKSHPLKSGPSAATINENPVSPLVLSSINLKSSISSCRSYIKSVKSNEIIKEKSSNTRKRSSKRKVIDTLSRDDSIESGYSSQSSVPSPVSTLLSADSLDESQTNKSSSMSSNLSNCTENSFAYNVNPSGEVVYIRSQYDFYLDKTSRRKQRTICDTKQQQMDVPCRVDHHQKVLEWQSKTLLHNQCPTPQHNHFEDTPPHSPQPVCDTNNNNQQQQHMPQNMEITEHSAKVNVDDDLLDLDCLQDWLDNSANNNCSSTISNGELDTLFSGAFGENFGANALLDLDFILS